MATKATLAYQQGCGLSTVDARNTFNSMRRRAILPALAELIPLVEPYPLSVYARDEPPQLLYQMDNGETAVVRSSTGVQQGCNLGPLCYGAGPLKLLNEINARPQVAGARVLAGVDGFLVILPTERARSAQVVEAVTRWIQKNMELWV